MAHAFGISTHLFHGRRLDRAHLAAVAAHGFELIEAYATRTHFDYHDPRAIDALAGWLRDTGLTLHSVHAPTTEGYRDGVWGETLSIASPDEGARRRAVDETKAALAVATGIPFRFLVVHLGIPSADASANSRAATARSLAELGDMADTVGVRLALELIPNGLSTPAHLVAWLEDEMEWPGAGICLDVGHAHLGGDVMEAVEVCSGHIVTTHLHDNSGRRDDHLVPGRGSVNWEGSMLAFQKVGYDGAWVFELAPAADPESVLGEAARARETLTGLLAVEP